MGTLAKSAVDAGVRRVVVAGGETSGAVVDALGVKSVVVDAEADRGVPWCSTPDHHISLLLKSGNFGQPDLLVRAATSRDAVMTIAAEIVELGASFFRRGLTFGRTGNLSAVDTTAPIIMTPTGVSLERLRTGSLSRVTLDGRHVCGPPPTKEAFLHLALYRARPQARAVVHTHSTHSVAVSCLRDVNSTNALPVLTAYYAMRVGEAADTPLPRPG